MPKESTSPLFSPDLHEIGTRLVDLLNQIGFLYRFPGLSGVTLACIAQHIGPMRALLDGCKTEREILGAQHSKDGFSVGNVNRGDPLLAAFEYAHLGYSSFKQQLAETLANAGDTPADQIQEIERALADEDAQAILKHKSIIESRGEQIAARAAIAFHPISDEDWQGFRMTLFYFLLELQNARKDPS